MLEQSDVFTCLALSLSCCLCCLLGSHSTHAYASALCVCLRIYIGMHAFPYAYTDVNTRRNYSHIPFKVLIG